MRARLNKPGCGCGRNWGNRWHPGLSNIRWGRSAERLLQKLEALAIAFAEEEKLTLGGGGAAGQKSL